MHNSSRKDKTCRHRRKTARAISDIRAPIQAGPAWQTARRHCFCPQRRGDSIFSKRGRAHRSRQQPQQFLDQCRKIRGGCRAARMYHDVPSQFDLLTVQSQNFAQSAPDSVAPHGSAQRFFDAPPESADVEAIGSKKYRKFAAGPAAPLAIHRVVFPALHQSAGARNSPTRCLRRA